MRQRRVEKLLRGVLVALALLAVSYGTARAYGPIKGAIHRRFYSPELVNASFIAELVPERESELRGRLLEEWRNGGSFGLHRIVRTPEGDPLQLWLVAVDHSLTLVTDYTRDPHSRREFLVEHPEKLEFQVPPGNEPLVAWFPPRDRELLRCTFADRSPAWF